MGVEIIGLYLSQNLRKHILDKIYKLLIKHKVIFLEIKKFNPFNILNLPKALVQ